MVCILWYTEIFFAKGDLVPWNGCRDILCLKSFGTGTDAEIFYAKEDLVSLHAEVFCAKGDLLPWFAEIFCAKVDDM